MKHNLGYSNMVYVYDILVS